jgi:hypothetical protein
MTDAPAARRFVTLHARLIDRRRIDGDPALVRSALAAYQNPDGGFGYLEPDLPDPGSQPITALAALEVLHEIDAPAGDPLMTGLARWLEAATHPDGGLDFVLPYDAEAIPHAPWMAPPDGRSSSLHMTAAVAAAAHRAGMARGPGRAWLERASAFVWEQVDRSPGPRLGYETKYVIDFLDAVPDRERAEAALDALAPTLASRDAIAVSGGTEGEALTALTIAPWPGHAGRRLFDADAIERQLDELAEGQAADGGWTFDWLAWDDAVAWAWRGKLTVDALQTLAANGRVAAAGA